jgi:hypothetical protein
MTYAVEEYDDDLAVARLAWLAHHDQAALDQACDMCLSYTDVDLGIRGRALGLLARVLYGDLPSDSAAQQREHRR